MPQSGHANHSIHSSLGWLGWLSVWPSSRTATDLRTLTTFQRGLIVTPNARYLRVRTMKYGPTEKRN